MRFAALVFFTFITAGFLIAQEQFFADYFIDNQNGWAKVKDQQGHFMSAKEGKLILENQYDNTTLLVFKNDLTIDTKRDFSLTCQMQWLAGDPLEGYGLIWGGRLEDGDHYAVCINSRSFIHYAQKDGNISPFISWTKSEFINAGGENKLEIRKIGSSLEVYINDTKVRDCNFSNFPGNSLGFVVHNKQKIAVDEITVNYLDASASDVTSAQLPPILSIHDIQLSSSSINSGGKIQLTLSVENNGEGDAKGAYVSLKSGSTELVFPPKVVLPLIAKNGGIQSVTIDIQGSKNLATSVVFLDAEVIEPSFGLRAKAERFTIGTNGFLIPTLGVAHFSATEGKASKPNQQINKNEEVNIRFELLNKGPGQAEEVNLMVKNNQRGVLFLGVVDAKGVIARKMPISFLTIAADRANPIVLRYLISDEFTDPQLEFKIETSEKYQLYGFSEVRFIPLDKLLSPESNVPINTSTIQVTPVVSAPAFKSDVDVAIPNNGIKNDGVFALVIGNENYSPLRNVPYAHRDAMVFKEYLVNTLGVPEKNIELLLDGTFLRMKKALKWISDIIKLNANDGSEVKIIFYYSGHGIPYSKNEQMLAYILPVDGSVSSDTPASEGEDAIKLSDIYRQLTINPTVEVKVFLDACFSGSAREVRPATIDTTATKSVGIKPQKDGLHGDIVVFSAAAEDQQAYPYPERQHGMFTYFLLKKLQETKGNVTNLELGAYIQENVEKQVKLNFRAAQNPTVRASMEIKSDWRNRKLK